MDTPMKTFRIFFTPDFRWSDRMNRFTFQNKTLRVFKTLRVYVGDKGGTV
jgi:hypothetical protein